MIQNVKQRTVFSLAAGIRPKIQKSDTRVNLELIPGFCDFRYHLIVMLRKGRGGGGREGCLERFVLLMCVCFFFIFRHSNFHRANDLKRIVSVNLSQMLEKFQQFKVFSQI